MSLQGEWHGLVFFRGHARKRSRGSEGRNVSETFRTGMQNRLLHWKQILGKADMNRSRPKWFAKASVADRPQSLYVEGFIINKKKE